MKELELMCEKNGDVLPWERNGVRRQWRGWLLAGINNWMEMSQAGSAGTRGKVACVGFGVGRINQWRCCAARGKETTEGVFGWIVKEKGSGLTDCVRLGKNK